MQVLYVDCCVRKTESRTSRLADAFLRSLKNSYPGHTLKKVVLQDEKVVPLNLTTMRRREALAMAGQIHDPIFRYAWDFAEVDYIVMAAPFWDMSFPALLKAYIEQVCMTDITFRYEDNRSVGLCSAEKLVYLTTAGGFIGDNIHGRGYIETVCNMLGIPEVYDVTVEGLDIEGADVEQLMKAGIEQAEALASRIGEWQ